MTQENDTICAVATAPGVGGIAVVRVSGPEAVETCQRLWRGRDLRACSSHTAHLGELTDPDVGETVDQAVATVYRAPRSFTGQDVVELSVHGSLWVQSETLRLLCAHGCRLAEPGEFTRRAFLSGRLDLAQAEATADLIAARTRAQARAANSQMRGDFSRELLHLRQELLQLASLLELEMDFSDQDVEFASRERLTALALQTLHAVSDLASTFCRGQALRHGIPVAIVGAPNAGKSTLLNALVRDDRAIVSPVAGTTRDTVEDTVEIHGRLYRLIDTAGLRDSADPVERQGIGRSLRAAAQAGVILLLTTPQDPPRQAAQLRADIDARRHEDSVVIELLNKADTIASPPPPSQRIPLTATDAESARRTVAEALDRACARYDVAQGDMVVTNARHHQALLEAASALERVISGLESGLWADMVAQDLRQCIHALGAITGQVTTPDILHHIFSRFCVGK